MHPGRSSGMEDEADHETRHSAYGRVRYVVLFALLLLAATAAPVLALPSESPEKAQGTEVRERVDPAVMAQAIEQVERDARQREETRRAARATPAAQANRSKSRSAYIDISAPAAKNLLVEAFPQQLDELNEDPGRVISDLTVKESLGPNSAIVEGNDGHTAIFESSVPLEGRAPEGGGSSIDLSLERTGNYFAPKNPLSEVQLPASTGNPILLESQVSIADLPGTADVPGTFLGNENLFFAETDPSTDTLLAPIARGVELFEQLRSPASPEEFRYTLSFPDGDQLREDGEGGAGIVDSSGEPMVTIPAPSAVDAEGQEIPTTMRVDGDGLVVQLAHRNLDVAYPILLDPEAVLENWENWYSSWNLGGLDHWSWEEYAAGGASYEHSKPGCIASCFGMGLYLRSRGEKVTYQANSYGQFVYWAPNYSAYISRAILQKVYGDVHNCPVNDPHGYAGLWDINSKSFTAFGLFQPLSFSNGSYDTGWKGKSGDRSMNISIGTSSKSSLTCGHDFYVGGVQLWLEDQDQPDLHSAGSSQWMDGSSVRLNVWAHDPGTGLKSFMAEATNKSGGTEKWETGPRCVGTAESPCSETWDLSQGSQALNYNPSVMSEGIDNLKITAYDAIGEPSQYSDTVTVRVDHSAPKLTVSGTVTEQASLGTSRPSYTIKAIAEDGVPGSKEPSDARAGVKNLRLFEDGTEIESEHAQPECTGTQSCKASREYEIPTLSRSVGEHKITVTSEDTLGHVAKKEITYTITRDTTAPTLSVTGLPVSGSPVGAHLAEVEASATDGGSGVTALKMLVDGEVMEEETQSCKIGGCGFKASLGADLTEISAAEHTIEIWAVDGQGNVSKESRDVVVDPTPPQIRLGGLVAERDREPLGAKTGQLSIEAGEESEAEGGNEGPPGLVAAYSFEEGSGEIAHDSAGTHDGTLHGVEWTKAGKYGGALHFNPASSARLTIPNSKDFDFAKGFTLEAWVRPDEARKESPLFAKVGSSGAFSYNLYARNGAGVTKGELSDGKGGWKGVEGSKALPIEAWSYVAMTSDGEKLRLYVDGKLAGSANALTPLVTEGELRIGGNEKWGEYFKGTIDNVRIYGAALGEEEVAKDLAVPVEDEEVTAGIASIHVELDEKEVAGFPAKCTSQCPNFTTSYTYNAEAAGPGPHTLYVEAVDELGNASSETLTVDVPQGEASTPTCSTETDEVPVGTAVSAKEAAESLEETLPEAIAPTEPGLDEMEEEEISPTFSKPNPNLQAEDSLAESETAVDLEGGIALNGVACLSPGETTSTATAASVVNSDSAVFANTSTEASTVVRPTAMGVTTITSVASPKAASTYTWNVKVQEGNEVVELPSGAVAIVEPTETEDETAEVQDKPETIEDPAALADAEAQRINGEYELSQATFEASGNVLAVVAEPWILLADETIIPAAIEVAPVVSEPNEFIVIIHMPSDAMAAAVYPAEVIATASTSSSAYRCLPGGSPCGIPDLTRASQYAVYWGNPHHVVAGIPARNPFYWDWGANNCTNFISQIIRAGGAKFMRYEVYGSYNGTWWYKRLRPWLDGDGYPFSNGDKSDSWIAADILPRHLWQYGLVHIDPDQEPAGWTRGDILAEDWFGTDGEGAFDHLQYVVGTEVVQGKREPLIANESSEGSNYAHMPWRQVRERIQLAEGDEGWQRAALAWKHTIANPYEKKHTPANLYGPNGLFNG